MRLETVSLVRLPTDVKQRTFMDEREKLDGSMQWSFKCQSKFLGVSWFSWKSRWSSLLSWILARRIPLWPNWYWSQRHCPSRSSSSKASRNAVMTCTISSILPWSTKTLLHKSLHLVESKLVRAADLVGSNEIILQSISSGNLLIKSSSSTTEFLFLKTLKYLQQSNTQYWKNIPRNWTTQWFLSPC